LSGFLTRIEDEPKGHAFDPALSGPIGGKLGKALWHAVWRPARGAAELLMTPALLGVTVVVLDLATACEGTEDLTFHVSGNVTARSNPPMKRQNSLSAAPSGSRIGVGAKSRRRAGECEGEV
jgi:hypothetical protein